MQVFRAPFCVADVGTIFCTTYSSSDVKETFMGRRDVVGRKKSFQRHICMGCDTDVPWRVEVPLRLSKLFAFASEFYAIPDLFIGPTSRLFWKYVKAVRRNISFSNFISNVCSKWQENAKLVARIQNTDWLNNVTGEHRAIQCFGIIWAWTYAHQLNYRASSGLALFQFPWYNKFIF